MKALSWMMPRMSSQVSQVNKNRWSHLWSCELWVKHLCWRKIQEDLKISTIWAKVRARVKWGWERAWWRTAALVIKGHLSSSQTPRQLSGASEWSRRGAWEAVPVSSRQLQTWKETLSKSKSPKTWMNSSIEAVTLLRPRLMTQHTHSLALVWKITSMAPNWTHLSSRTPSLTKV